MLGMLAVALVVPWYFGQRDYIRATATPPTHARD
jgi:hypothetical protein